MSLKGQTHLNLSCLAHPRVPGNHQTDEATESLSRKEIAPASPECHSGRPEHGWRVYRLSSGDLTAASSAAAPPRLPRASATAICASSHLPRASAHNGRAT